MFPLRMSRVVLARVGIGITAALAAVMGIAILATLVAQLVFLFR